MGESYIDPASAVDELRDIDGWFAKKARAAGMVGFAPGQTGDAQRFGFSQTSGWGPDATDAAATMDIFGELVSKVGVQEEAQKKMSAKLTHLNTEMQSLLAKKIPRGRSRAAEQADDKPRGRSKTAEQADRISNKLQKPRVRPCACGCGGLVREGDANCEGEVTALCAKRMLLNDELKTPSVDARAQQALIERLCRREPRKLEEPEQPAAHLRRPPDMERLRALAQPREEAWSDPDALKRVSSGRSGDDEPTLPRSMSVPGPRWAPHQLPAPSRRASVQAAGPGSPGVGGPLGTAGLAALAGATSASTTSFDFYGQIGSRRRAAKLDATYHQNEDLPGLSQLLDTASFEDVGRAYVDALEEPTVRKMRTRKSQQSYLEERLYSKPGPKPGSVAALQAKLEALQAERRARQASFGAKA